MDTNNNNTTLGQSLASYGTAGLFVAFLASLLKHYGIILKPQEAIGMTALLGHLAHYVVSLKVLPLPLPQKAPKTTTTDQQKT